MHSETTIFRYKYLYLLLSLITYFLTMAFLIDHDIKGAGQAFLFALIILFSVYAISHQKIILIITVLLGLITFAESLLMYLNLLSDKFATRHYVTNCIFLAVVIYSVITNLLSHKKITVDTLLGAICGYILLGLLWTFFYMTLSSLNPDAFAGAISSESVQQKIQHFAYYSYITLTTVGYGDIAPLSSMARTLAWLEAVTGQVYLTIWIAHLVALHVVYKQKK